MALTFSEQKLSAEARGQYIATPVGAVGKNSKITVTEVTFDSSYPTGGEAVTAANLGLTTLREVIGLIDQVVGQDIHALWDRANSKIVLQVVSTGAEAANGSDQSSVKVVVVALGE